MEETEGGPRAEREGAKVGGKESRGLCEGLINCDVSHGRVERTTRAPFSHPRPFARVSPACTQGPGSKMRTIHHLDTVHPLQMAATQSQTLDPLPDNPDSLSPPSPNSPSNIAQIVVNAIANPTPASSSSQNASQGPIPSSSATHSPPPPSVSPISASVSVSASASASASALPPLPPPPPSDVTLSIQSILAASSKQPSPPNGQQPPWSISQMVMPVSSHPDQPPPAPPRSSVSWSPLHIRFTLTLQTASRPSPSSPRASGSSRAQTRRIRIPRFDASYATMFPRTPPASCP